jgi:hypothetical protein
VTAAWNDLLLVDSPATIPTIARAGAKHWRQNAVFASQYAKDT